MLIIKETGVAYNNPEPAFKYAERKGLSVAKVDRPLTYTTHETTRTNPLTGEVTTTEHKAYVDDITEEEVANGVRVLRDLKFAETTFAVERHREELELGLATSLTEVGYQDVLQYRQDLRDLPTQTWFPESVAWPSLSLGGVDV